MKEVAAISPREEEASTPLQKKISLILGSKISGFKTIVFSLPVDAATRSLVPKRMYIFMRWCTQNVIFSTYIWQSLKMYNFDYNVLISKSSPRKIGTN